MPFTWSMCRQAVNENNVMSTMTVAVLFMLQFRLDFGNGVSKKEFEILLRKE